MEERRKEELHEEGLNHVGSEIESRMKAKDYFMHIKTCTQTHMCT